MTKTLRRRLAESVLGRAARVMPAGEPDWGKAMRRELEVLEDDREALRWALGCIIAGCRERVNVMLQTWCARSALACLILLLAGREFFAPLLILAYRMHYLGLAHFLGLRTAGSDYRRLVPLLDSTPLWLPVLWTMAGLLYLAAVLRLLRGSAASVVLFFFAFGLDLAGMWAVKSVELSTGVVAEPNPWVRAAGFLLTLSAGFVLWRVTQKKLSAAS